ncbi:MAG: hypothetical protein QOG68_1437 [Solirubrobacteraceae bacterium]|nr:hypothetical protein [Solirubrobacteraceae bacterium]
MPTPLAADDIAPTHAAAAGRREPLVVVDRLCRFLDARGIGHGQPKFMALGDGHSNVTLAVRRGDAHIVLRRPPRGPLPLSAHDVLREARIIAALAGRLPVPDVLATCEFLAVIGAPFVLLSFVAGERRSIPCPAGPRLGSARQSSRCLRPCTRSGLRTWA